MENNNKTFTFTEREILLLYFGLAEMKLDFISDVEKAIDKCYSRGDIEGVEKLQFLIDEFFELHERLRPYVGPELYFEELIENYEK